MLVLRDPTQDEHRRSWAAMHEKRGYMPWPAHSSPAASRGCLEALAGRDGHFVLVQSLGEGAGEHSAYVRHGQAGGATTNRSPLIWTSAGEVQGAGRTQLLRGGALSKPLATVDDGPDCVISTRALERPPDTRVVI